MVENSVERRLAAILVADVVGYSKLMGEDEAGTLAALRELRAEVVDPRINEHKGRLFKTTGDGLLVEFSSVVNAVTCAVDIQRAMAARSAGTGGSCIAQLRIGVNLGDVIIEGNDVFGDGVNVAARLEGLAPPGSIAVSAMVRDNIGNRLDLPFEDIGEQSLKNIAAAVRVYVLRLGGMSPPAPGLALPAKPSLAVLPFENLSGDLEQGYFSDGITEDIIAELSKFREFLVIARNSSFQFRGKSNDVAEVARKLGVQYVVEGSIRKIGNRVRVAVQLIDAHSAAHVWAEHYDRELDDIFAIQDEITQMISARLARQTRTAITSRSRVRPTGNMSAYDCYLRALQLASVYDTVLQAESYLQTAIELDPGFAGAHAMLSFVESIKFYWNDDRNHLASGLAMAKTALQLDPEETYGHLAAGFALLYLRRFREAETSLDRAVALNPNDPFIRSIRAILLNYTGRPVEALAETDEAERRDPFALGWLEDFRGIMLTTAGRYREAIASYAKLASVPPWSLIHLTVCHAELGEVKHAEAILAKLKACRPGLSIDEIFDIEDLFEDPAVYGRYRTILRRLEKEE